MPGINGLCCDCAEKKHHATMPSPWGQHSYALVLAQPSYHSAHLHVTIYTTPFTLHRQHNTIYTYIIKHNTINTHTIYTTSSTNIINTTSSTHTSSHTGRRSTWNSAILPLPPQKQMPPKQANVQSLWGCDTTLPVELCKLRHICPQRQERT